MARRGDVIEHPVTGERMTFLETAGSTGGELVRIELAVGPHGFVAAPHVHPLQEETFEILSGTFDFVLDGDKKQVGPGEGATVPPGMPHAWWNPGDEPGLAIVEIRPALKAEEFFETMFGLAKDGKVSEKTGLPNLLWIAVATVKYHRDFAHIARPPLFVQLAIFAPLAFMARLLGYRLPRPYPYARPGATSASGVSSDARSGVGNADRQPARKA
jgi:quercetin dioxygenase-like cupin family protein